MISSLGEVTGLIWGAGHRGQCYFTAVGLDLEDIKTAVEVESYQSILKLW